MKNQSFDEDQLVPLELKESVTTSAPSDNSNLGSDEDNLDDLDGMMLDLDLRCLWQLIRFLDLLDEFSEKKIETKQRCNLATEPDQIQEHKLSPGSSSAAADEFGRQLQEQMAALMGEVDESPEVRREIETMMQELGTRTDLGDSRAHNASSEASGSSSSEKPFQETIRKTMERMQVSGEQATEATASEDSTDILNQILKEMQSGGLEGAENEEHFSKMLIGMMEELTNKEILLDPMNELHQKLPAWISKNRASTDGIEMKRYEEQQKIVGEIVGKFNEKGYSDSNTADREFIVERMQQVRS